MKQHTILSVAIISLIIILTPIKLASQAKKGNLLIEGNLGNIKLSDNKVESIFGTYASKSESNEFDISLFPRIGYFLNDKCVLGTTLNFSYQSNKYKSYWDNGAISFDGKSNGSTIGLSPFLRYYFNNNPKTKLYGQLGGGINIDIFRNYEGTSFKDNGEIFVIYENPSKGSVLSGEALIGFNHFFTDNVAFNSSIGYNYSVMKQSATSNSSDAGITYPSQEFRSTNRSGNIIWDLGFTLIIARKKD